MVSPSPLRFASTPQGMRLLQLMAIVGLVCVGGWLVANETQRARVQREADYRKRMDTKYTFKDATIQRVSDIRMQWANPPAIDGEYYMPNIASRYELPIVLQELHLHVGLELGVQAGDFALHLLRNWPQCTKYYLVDPWRPVQNYADLANVDAAKQTGLMETTRTKLLPFIAIITMLRMTGAQAAKQINDSALDFVYIDARHDYCATSNDMETWWPKLRAGGVFAGHDYNSHEHVAPAQDWTLCEDGSRQPGAVKRAVDEFARRRRVVISLTYAERGGLAPSWMIRKPF